nr:DUF3261 domain-containing protein [uncultured Treponema sp.]
MAKVSKIHGMFISLSLLASVILVSCASSSVEPEPKTPAVYVTNFKKVNVLPADKIQNPIDEVQLFEGTFGDKSFSMPLYIQADENGLNVSLLNDFGTSVGDLSYAEDAVSFDSPMFSDNAKAEYIVWDIQLSFYKPEEISKCLSKSKLTFTVEDDGETEIRKIFDGKELIEEVTLRNHFVQIKNLLRGYEYHLIGVGDE